MTSKKKKKRRNAARNKARGRGEPRSTASGDRRPAVDRIIDSATNFDDAPRVTIIKGSKSGTVARVVSDDGGASLRIRRHNGTFADVDRSQIAYNNQEEDPTFAG